MIGNDLTKTDPTVGWNAGAVGIADPPAAQSNKVIRCLQGGVEFSTTENDRHKMLALSRSGDFVHYHQLDFAISLTATGKVQVLELGTVHGSFGTYAPGDLFRIDVDDNVVTHLQNGSVFYTSTVLAPPENPIDADDDAWFAVAAFRDPGATITDVVQDSYFTTNVPAANDVALECRNRSFLKHDAAATSWDIGAASPTSIDADGYVEFTTDENTLAKMAGLSHDDAGGDYVEIDYAIFLTNVSRIAVYENGVRRGTNYGTYAPGDTFRVEVRGGVVRYWKNNAVFYTSAVAPTFPLGFDSSFKDDGATLVDVRVATATPGFWQNPVSVEIEEVNANLLRKIGSPGWNGGASSTGTLSGNGSATFASLESNTAKMIGLNHDDTDTSYADIDYAIFLSAAGKVQIYESGTLRGAFGAYSAEERFFIQVIDGVVIYRRGNHLIYTSTVPPVFPLRLDTSLNHVGATVYGPEIDPL